jgi:hypothetical protein
MASWFEEGCLVSTRRRAVALLALEMLYLSPVLIITVAYYLRVWSSPWGVSDDWPVLAIMALVSLSIVGGPLAVTAAALVMIRSAQASRVVLNCALVGGIMSAARSTPLFVAAKPPDLPVRGIGWVMVVSSLVVVVLSHRWIKGLTSTSNGLQ